LVGAVNSLQDRGGTAFVVIPAFNRNDVKCSETEHFNIWEVEQ